MLEKTTEEILRLAVNGIEFCERGGILDEYLDSLKESMPRKTISSILFNYYRAKGIVDFYIDKFSKSKTQSFIKRVLYVVFTQIIFQTAIPNEIITDVAVSFVKKRKSPKSGGFVNAVVRQLVNQLPDILKDIKSVKPELLIPNILWQRWKRHYSKEELEKIFEAIKEKPPFTFRFIRNSEIPDEITVNYKKVEGLEFLKNFSFYSSERPECILDSYLMKEGRIYIQDPASVLIGEILSKLKIQGKILDYCSAPGGKTLILSELFRESEVIATDRSFIRLERVRENVDSFKLENVSIVEIEKIIKMPDASFDMIVLDVPCSNTGVIRHRPDVMWNFSLNSLQRIVELQKEILNKVYTKLKKSNFLVYSTCSIEPEENQLQVRNFVREHSNFVVETEKLLLPTLFNDGNYVALLRRLL